MDLLPTSFTVMLMLMPAELVSIPATLVTLLIASVRSGRVTNWPGVLPPGTGVGERMTIGPTPGELSDGAAVPKMTVGAVLPLCGGVVAVLLCPCCGRVVEPSLLPVLPLLDELQAARSSSRRNTLHV